MSDAAPGPNDLAGRVVVVTGASSGIGAATARAFARRGATVGLVARREERLAEVLDACRTHAPESQMFVADLADLEALPAIASQVIGRFGAVHVLVNNAGIPKRRTVATMSAEDIDEVMRMNYLSPVRLTLALLPDMIALGDAHVVNVSSMGAHMVAFGVGAYAASKAALEMFTESLYLELSDSGVHAHLVVPGTTQSEFSTPRAGNDAPFPSDPATTASPETVAEAIIACLTTDDLITYATERDAAMAAGKRADPNAFLAGMRSRLAGLRRA